MFMNLTMIIYLSIIIQTIFISVSSSNWLLIWMMMEMNLMMFIPFICTKKYLTDSSPSVKYFLAQVLGSLLLILFIVLSSLKYYTFSLSEFNSLFLLVAMAIKSGTPPFHFWFPQLVEMSNWIQMMALLTLQKIIPIIFLFYSMNFMFPIILMSSGLIGALGGFNQNSMKKIIAYSSMTHTGWMMLAMTYSLKLSLFYFFVYSFTIIIFIILIKNSSMSLNSSNMNSSEMFLLVSVCVCMFSISGLPPFVGFLIKLMVIFFTLKNFLLIFFMLISSLISVVYYMRIIYFFSVLNSLLNKSKINTLFIDKSLILYIVTLNLFLPFIIILNN